MTTTVETSNLALLAKSKCAKIQSILKEIEILEKQAAYPNILIVGETGTGKNLVAQAIHELRARHKTGGSVPFEVIGCNEIGETYFNAERARFFGNTKGAFTQATQAQTGGLEKARKGTLFLDFVQYLPRWLQYDLKRALDTEKFRKVGGKREQHLNTQIISATSKNLREPKFDYGLYLRLSMHKIALPPLRERQEDIIPLAEYFLIQAASETGGKPKTLSESAQSQLLEYKWPGNIREFRSVMRNMGFMLEHNVIEADDLMPKLS